jgi:hypothetical protein
MPRLHFLLPPLPSDSDSEILLIHGVFRLQSGGLVDGFFTVYPLHSPILNFVNSHGAFSITTDFQAKALVSQLGFSSNPAV